MGEQASLNDTGSFYLSTNVHYPYARGWRIKQILFGYLQNNNRLSILGDYDSFKIYTYH